MRSGLRSRLEGFASEAVGRGGVYGGSVLVRDVAMVRNLTVGVIEQHVSVWRCFSSTIYMFLHCVLAHQFYSSNPALATGLFRELPAIRSASARYLLGCSKRCSRA